MIEIKPSQQSTCFFEADPDASLASRALAEGIGTLLLTAAIASAGLMAQRLTHEAPLLQLFASAVVVAGALVGLICAFSAVSGGHFNPLITALQWLAGERGFECTAVYIISQTIGAFIGSELANLVSGGSVSPATAPPIDVSLVLGEALATTGLMIVVLGCARSGRVDSGPFAVGAWLVAAILFTPSGSYANPAVTLASIVSLGQTHLSASTAFGFVVAEVGGGVLALVVISATHPRARAATGRQQIPTTTGL